ncbi:MAG: YraN family protein [Clostridia bacterium]|nr:YraN family protein [Clostridia bacterium]MBQ2947568.1 YraN family protein [Clostridia bacterium]MBQ4609270.1 YraN family protein [Clostridia bacterium]
MSRTSDVRGALGEVRAEQVLLEKGYEILARNVASPGAEIDLIACDGAAIVFVEVKTRTRPGVTGREAVTVSKQKRICKGAMYYLMRNGLMNRQARFDVIEIQGERVTHIVNAFPYQGPAY